MFKINTELLDSILTDANNVKQFPDFYCLTVDFEVYIKTVYRLNDSNYKAVMASEKSTLRTIWSDLYRSEILKATRFIDLIATAKIFKDEVLYFPIFLDFRCRLYYKGFPLNPQGDSLTRGLLLPYEGVVHKKLSKKKFNYLTELFLLKRNKHVDLIEEFEINRILQHKGTNLSKVYLDVTSSGLQIIGFILRDISLLKTTRYLASESFIDIYTYFRNYIEENSNLVFTREGAKKILMRYSYNQETRALSFLVKELLGEKPVAIDGVYIS